MRLRLATINDREVIVRLHCDSWEANFLAINPELVKARGDQYPRRFQQWTERLRDEQLITFVALDENETIIGFGQGGAVLDDRELPEYDAELTLLYIAPNHKGQGIGKKLINKVAISLKELGKQSLVVVAWSINESAKAVYQHLGAEFVKEVKQTKDGFDNSQTIYVWENINTVIEATS